MSAICLYEVVAKSEYDWPYPSRLSGDNYHYEFSAIFGLHFLYTFGATLNGKADILLDLSWLAECSSPHMASVFGQGAALDFSLTPNKFDWRFSPP